MAVYVNVKTLWLSSAIKKCKILGFENSENGNTDGKLLRSTQGERHFRVLALQ